MNRTLCSATLSIEGEGCKKMVDEWQGTLKWISQSPYRDSSSAKELVRGVNVFTVHNIKDADTKNLVINRFARQGREGIM